MAITSLYSNYVLMKYFLTTFLFLLFFSTLSIAGFAKKKKSTSYKSISGKYEVVNYTYNNNIIPIQNRMTSMTLNTKSGNISCNVGCNTIGGELKVIGKKLVLKHVFSTEKYCQEVAELETQFVENLNRINRWDRKGKIVMLKENNLTLIQLRRVGN